MDDQHKHSFSYSNVCLLPKEQIGIHRQPTWELSYIVNGSGTRRIGDREEPFSRGEVVLIPPEIPHCWHFDGGDLDPQGRIANITLIFSDELLEKCVMAFPEFKGAIHIVQNIRMAIRLDKDKSLRIVPVLKEMSQLDSARKVVSFMSILLILSSSGTDCIVGSKQNEDKEKKRIDKIKTYVTCNAVRDISLDDIAKHVGMNRSSFCVFFKRVFRKTFFEYLNEYRIFLACQLLAQGKMTISEVCFQSGFNGVPYFSRVFRKVMGASPKNYRQIGGLPDKMQK